MTCIIGIIERGAILMGADSAGVGGYSLTIRADQKVFINGPFVMGFTTSFRMGQLLRYKFNPPPHPPGMDDHEFMVKHFVEAVRTCLKDGGFAEKKNEQESGGTFLVGYHGRLFRIESDYQVAESVHGYESCGCGDDIAKGALHVTPRLTAKRRILAALHAAEQFSAGVRGPFSVLSGGKK